MTEIVTVFAEAFSYIFIEVLYYKIGRLFFGKEFQLNYPNSQVAWWKRAALWVLVVVIGIAAVVILISFVALAISKIIDLFKST